MSFKIERLRRRVRVKHVPLQNDWYYNSITEEEAIEISKWVEDREMGKRIAFDIWKLKDNACVTMFILHWGNQ